MYSISTDKTKMDINAIHDYLSHRSYWAKGRSREAVEESMKNCLCFAVYDDTDKLCAFARVLSDGVAIAYIMDVFVLEEYRGNGLAKMLMHAMLTCGLKVRRWLLATVDAQGLYKQFGFRSLRAGIEFLEIIDETVC